eukprot:TRINITY_DN17212_c0_g1_i1.p1 TRINITY_DN17212_c0_g1~~TRINITY_DN17212_c0_g1_i1.p1  ORF type:complete len:538 (+),score=97.14 TRINITY_DN17212_c0_g1_i1:3-1616(+)
MIRMSSSVVLGFDLSTQSLSVLILSGQAELGKKWETEREYSINYDTDLPEYKTKGGVLRAGDGTVTSPTIMWVEALDIVLTRMKEDGFDFSRVVAISVSGQQHGSVYWKKGSESLLSKLDSSSSLRSQLKDTFSREQSPVWMDSSTHHICQEIEELMGGSQKVSSLTGSCCFERFTIHQIAKIFREDKQAIENTERISLVSSFLTSLFASRYAPIDPADGSGMNAMNIVTKKWIPEILEYATPGIDLGSLLGDIRESYETVDNVSEYMQARYNFSPSCLVIVGSGDNPCTMAGLKLHIGDMAVSLGTSDTLFGPIESVVPSQNVGSMMCSPLVPNQFMGMVCMKNGSFTRQEIRDKFAYGDWKTFSEILSKTQPGNDGKIGFYFLEREIVPFVKGFHYFSVDKEVQESDWSPEAHVRGVVESQFLLIYLHSRTLGFNLKGILATGGGSKNEEILKVLSNVFGVPVMVGEVAKSAALGSAYRALHGYYCHREQTLVPFSTVVGDLEFTRKIEPDHEAHKVYLGMLDRYSHLLQEIVEK